MSDPKTDILPGAVTEKKPQSFMADLVVRIIKEKPLGTIGGIIVLAMFFIGIFANLLSPFPPNETHAKAVLSPPSNEFALGTDNLGRDLLTRTLYGARISMSVGLAVPAINLLIALLIGVTSGFRGGRFDIITQRFVDSWMCFPNFLLLLTIMSLTGPGLLQVIVVLGVVGGIPMSRTIRSAVISIKENMYVNAAEAIGSSTWQTIVRHILPNIMPIVIILFTLHMATAILHEAALSFLGFGVPPPNPSWGGMLSQEGRKYMLIAPWMAFWPGLALSVAVYSISMLGDALRDILDPRLRGSQGRYRRVVRKMARADK